MNPLASIIIYSTLIMGTLITMMSSHWILAWMGLEINMFAIIPLIMKTHSPRAIEASTKYFLTQALASMLFLMSITLNYLYSGHWMLMSMNNSMAELLIITAMMMKLGMTPFHFWVPEVTQGTTLSISLIILTWQKIAPLIILYQLISSINSSIILSSAILSIMIGGWGGLNQTQLRKIMAYSSISHMGWMAIIIIYNPSLTMLNLLLYILFTFSAFIILINCFSTSTSSLTMAWNNSPLMMFLLLNILLSMGGLPPLTGFSPKWLIINELIKNNTIILALTISILALLNLYFYLRIIYASSMTLFPTNSNLKLKWKMHSSYKLIMLPTIISISIFFLPLTPLMLIME
uniref:NADH-ubiquinone oxidoreductase chain 2 n=1 Tax=Hemicentetes nigriceps TaxID=1432851 RepID=A0A165QSA6_9EUTH|nr:NADH dehydrogenase subunit 2 [Hemicentetes nigriceps]